MSYPFPDPDPKVQATADKVSMQFISLFLAVAGAIGGLIMVLVPHYNVGLGLAFSSIGLLLGTFWWMNSKTSRYWRWLYYPALAAWAAFFFAALPR